MTLLEAILEETASVNGFFLLEDKVGTARQILAYDPRVFFKLMQCIRQPDLEEICLPYIIWIAKMIAKYRLLTRGIMILVRAVYNFAVCQEEMREIVGDSWDKRHFDDITRWDPRQLAYVTKCANLLHVEKDAVKQGNARYAEFIKTRRENVTLEGESWFFNPKAQDYWWWATEEGDLTPEQENKLRELCAQEGREYVPSHVWREDEHARRAELTASELEKKCDAFLRHGTPLNSEFGTLIKSSEE